MNEPLTIVITGASAGVGRATAMAFARGGARIGLIAREADALAETVEDVQGAGGVGLALPLDLADAEAVRAAADRVEAELGPIDLWINAAMLTVFSPIRELSASEIRRVTEVTYLGSVNGILAALAHMRPRGRGTILQVGSALAYRGIPLQSAYCGAKFALRGFLGSLHSELLSEGSAIRVSMVELPAVNTPQFEWARTHVLGEPRPVAPVFQPEAVADALVKAALKPRREYWLGWSSIKTIIGAQLMPEYLDRYLARHVVSGQQTDQPVDPGRADNLMVPAPSEMHRVHGRFDDESSSELVMLEPASVRRAVIGGGLALAAGIGAAVALVVGGRNGGRRPVARGPERRTAA